MGNTAIPPANLGTNIGSIDDSSGTWVFNPAEAGTWNYTAPDSIITCANASGSKAWVRLEYTYTDADGTEQTTFQIGHINPSGSCFLVVDVSSASVSVYVNTSNGVADPPGDDDWGEPINTTEITVGGRPVPTGATIILADDPSTGMVAGPTSAVLTASDDDTVTVTNNSSADPISVWVNNYNGNTLKSIAKGSSQIFNLGSLAKWQWTLGFDDKDDPQIVIKRPPSLTE